MSYIRVVRLGDVCRVVSGATPRTGMLEYWGGPILWATPADLSKLIGMYIGSTERTLTEDGLRSCGATILPAGSVLLSSRAPIGHVAINRKPMATNQGFKSLVPNGAEVDAPYLYYWLRTNRTYLESLGNGATFKEVSMTTISNVEIPLPPLGEQRQIAEILGRMDSLRARRREALSRLDELAQSTFLELFGDPFVESSRFGRVPMATLGQLDRGISKHRPRNDSRLLGGRYPLIQTGDVARSGGYIDRFSATYSDMGLAQSKMWPQGTLCITIAANIAKAGILEFDACFPDSVVGFVADPNTTEFVRVWLSFMQERLERMAPESAQKNINLAVLRTLMIPRPPDHMIAAFGNRLRSVRTLQLLGRSHLEASNALFEALQYRAFRGKL